MKLILSVLLSLSMMLTKAQNIKNIYVNLYTDSLKKGTYNYINIDGELSNGSFLPLDSTHLIFSASSGTFIGNTLFIDKNSTVEKVTIKVTVRKNPSLFKEFDIWIKKLETSGKLKTTDEVLQGMKKDQSATKTKKKKASSK